MQDRAEASFADLSSRGRGSTPGGRQSGEEVGAKGEKRVAPRDQKQFPYSQKPFFQHFSVSFAINCCFVVVVEGISPQNCIVFLKKSNRKKGSILGLESVGINAYSQVNHK